MSSFLAAIAAALRAMPRFVGRVIWDGAKWIVRLFREDPPPAVEVPLELVKDRNASPSVTVADYSQLRTVAQRIYDDLVLRPEHVDGLHGRQVRWVNCLTEEMLELVIDATDRQLDDHMRGRKAIRGLLLCDDQSIKDLERAVAIDREQARRVLIRVDIRRHARAELYAD